jgi:hypothetical protein
MGHRINYVIKNGDQLTIYHHRWGSISIAADLYPGKEAFLRYLGTCTIETELREHLWMEGFVMADIENKRLGFWAWEFENETSVIRYYISELEKIWPGWQVMHLANEMYDAAPLPGIDYFSKQPFPEFKSVSAIDIMNDPLPGDYPYVLFIIRQNGKIFVAETAGIMLESIICYGEDIITLLNEKTAIPLPAEGQTRTPEQLFIDADNKQLIVNNSIFGLWETMANKWPGYTFKMGNMGYLAMLEEANIPTAGLQMPHEEILKRFADMIKARNTDL